MGELLSLGRTGDAAQFITLASLALAGGTKHDGLRLLLVQKLAAEGLLRRAWLYFQGISPAVRQHEEVAPLAQALAAPGSLGFVAWQTLARQYELNLHALRDRGIDAGPIDAAWEANRRHLELHRTRTGRWAVFDRRGGGCWRPCFDGGFVEQEARRWSAQLNGRVLPPIGIDGIGLGYHLGWLYEATADTYLGASTVLYQIEPEWLGLAVVLHLHDWHRLLADPRVTLCAGPDAYAEFAADVRRRQWRTLPHIVVRPPAWNRSAAQDQEVISALTDEFEQVRQALQDELAASNAPGDAAHWQRRYAAALAGDAPPLRVLGITSRFTTVLQYAMRDALAALAACGCEAHTLIEDNAYERTTALDKLSAAQCFRPDLILLIDHVRHGQHQGMPENVPMVTWIQDRLPWLFSRDTGASFGLLDFCMGLCREELVGQYGFPGERFLACEMATNPNVLWPDVAEAERIARAGRHEPHEPYTCDVAYATNYLGTPEKFCRDYQLRHECPPGLLQALGQALLGRLQQGALHGGAEFEPLLDAAVAQLKLDLSVEQRNELLQGFLRPLADRLLRLQTVAWLVRWTTQTGRRLHLYGHGWEEHPQYKAFARGFVEHGPELGRVMRAARLFVHAGCNSAFHQRVLDGLAAGGFLVLRRHADDVARGAKLACWTAVRDLELRAGDVLTLDRMPPDAAGRLRHYRMLRGQALETPIVVNEATLAAARSLSIRPAERQPWVLWPELDEVTFASYDEMAGRFEHFIAHPEARQQIAQRMRARMLEHFGYEALMRRLLDWLTERLGAAAGHARRNSAAHDRALAAAEL